ncbi:MAG: hypothetical protein IAE86_14345 [Burkholderiaceae bacterium]|nr:hypothetical protein [Burkholderiaceae bacterium]
MAISSKPKSALLAYCALADRLHQPGAGPIQALTPFFASVCRMHAGELFDAAKFSASVAGMFGLQIPRLAALGLAEQLEREGLLEALSGHATSTVYRYSTPVPGQDDDSAVAVSEPEIDQVLAQFVAACRADPLLAEIEEVELQTGFLDRLLHADSMRLLHRREGSTAAKRGTSTLTLAPQILDAHERRDLRLDYQVAQFLLDLRDHHQILFDKVSDIAFANMAAEALACFSEPAGSPDGLKGMVVYLDSPLLLDVLGVNADYAEYGRELLDMVKASGAVPAVLDDCAMEAESVVAAQLASARSGISQKTSHWGTAAKPHILNALKDNIGIRAVAIGVEVHKDPDIALFRRSTGTYGDIQVEMTRRMQSWPNDEARHHDERSIWSMLKIRDSSSACFRICDSKALFIARNTALVKIANDAWRIWLKGQGKHSQTIAERWAQVAMSDKQLAGYLWLRRGIGNGQMSKVRLLAHCSAAVRPRPDVKAKAYNLALELHGKDGADHLAALLEDREGERALMRAVRADPEDVTAERLPYIIEQVRLGAGEFAAATVRAEGAERLAATQRAHEQEVARLLAEAHASKSAAESELSALQTAVVQKKLDSELLAGQVNALNLQVAAQGRAKSEQTLRTLEDSFRAGAGVYRRVRWLLVLLFASIVVLTTTWATDWPELGQLASFLLAAFGFWFVPEVLERPVCWLAARELRLAARRADVRLELPTVDPDFKAGTWVGLDAMRARLEKPTTAPE